MKLELVDADADMKPVTEPWLVRMPGWTWERYLDEAPEMRFCEYKEGELIMHSPVSWEHQDLVAFLSALLRMYCSKHGLGRVGNGPAIIQVGPQTGREPDIFVIPPEQAHKARGKRLEIVPSLIVEVVSPGSRALDLGEKAGEYADLGVGEYWVADRERKTLHVHRLHSGAYRRRAVRSGRLESHALRGFWVRVDWLWRDPLPSEPDCLEEIEKPAHVP